MKKIIISLSIAVLCIICLVTTVMHYHNLESIPYGYHVDEYSGSVDIGCMATEGVDAHNVPYPLFSNLNYGTPKPPTYIYPGILWAKFSGYSIPSLRAFSVTVYTIGILGLIFLARLLFGWRYSIITACIACLSPWTWGLSRVAFESLFSMTFMVWGIYFFLKPSRILWSFTAGLLFAAAMYSYPPYRLQIPLMVVTLLIYTAHKNPRALKSWVSFAIAFILPLIPLAQKTLSGEIQKRFNSISIFSKDYLDSIHSSGSIGDMIKIFFHNYILHFNLDFLFVTGDPSYVHSTRHFGLLSWLDIAAFGLALVWGCLLLTKKSRADNPLKSNFSLLIFLFINVLIGVLPSALTNSELPNSLRITPSWPFLCLMNGFLIWRACEYWWGAWVVTSLLSILFAFVFLRVYFEVFPQEGKGMFGYWTLEQANQIKTDEDWMKFLLLYRFQDYNARYYLMQYRGFTCTQSRNVWEGLRDYLKSKGKYYQ